MTRTFKFLTALAAVFGTLTQAQQQLTPTDQDNLEKAFQVIPIENQVSDEATFKLESDADIKLEETISSPKKRKGKTIPLTSHVFKGEEPLIKAARQQAAERERQYKLATAPQVTNSSDKSFMNQIYDKVFGNKSASFDQRQFELKESESTAPTEYYDQTMIFTNLVNQIYTMPLYFGTEKLPFNLAIDTAFELVVLKTVECTVWDWDEEEDTDEPCTGNLYDPETSDDFDDLDESQPVTVTIELTEVYVSGYMVTDLVCLDTIEEDLCIENYLWGDIRQQSNFPAVINGVIGITTGQALPPGFPVLPPTFLKTLADGDQFSENIIAIAFKGFEQDTFMDIGEIFDENMSDEEDLVYFSVSPYSLRWATTISGVQFGENDTRQFVVPTAQANFDSNIALILVPDEQWEHLINQLVRNLEYDQYTIDYENYTCHTVCDPELFYDMYFFLDGQYWAQVLAEDLILDLSLTQDGQDCVIGITRSGDATWALGIPFLRGYYVVFDGENQRTGVVPYAGSPKEELYTGEQPEETLTLDEAGNWATYGFVAAIVVVLGFEIGGSYFGS